MAVYITLDGGTTNARLYLVRDRQIADARKLAGGLKGGLPALKQALSEGISSLLKENGLAEEEVTCILCSGMITSEYGLCHLPHLTAPVGKKEMKDGMHKTSLPEISDIPFVFIRGVRTDADTFREADMVRGEETEIMGLVGDDPTDTLYVLPGSHSKHMAVDGDGRIVSIRTVMSGELFAAVMQNTVLRDTTDFAHNTVKKDYLECGYTFCRERGIGEALFKTRVLKNLFSATKEDCFSFLLGVVLCNEVEALLSAKEERIVIGGQRQFREALFYLLAGCGKQVTMLSDEEVGASVALGAVAIYEA